MRRFLILLLVVTVLVAGLAWATSRSAADQGLPLPPGPGVIA